MLNPFKYLQEKKSSFGNYWDITEYYENNVGDCVDRLGSSGEILLGLDEDNPRNQKLHDAVVCSINVDFSKGGLDNESDIVVGYDLAHYQVFISYLGVEVFCFGQRGTFSPILEVDVHELTLNNDLYEHRVLCHGSEQPLFVSCRDIRVEKILK